MYATKGDITFALGIIMMTIAEFWWSAVFWAVVAVYGGFIQDYIFK